jgi:hypothetical protein
MPDLELYMLKFRKGWKDPTAWLDMDRVTNMGAAGALVLWKLAALVLKWEILPSFGNTLWVAYF